jgi:hypothetical protein
MYGLWNGEKFLHADSGNIFKSDDISTVEAARDRLIASGAAGVEIKEIPLDIYDHQAFTCGKCGSSSFTLLRSMKIECAGCMDELSASWLFV